jgi:hypothetical protein
MGYYQGDFYAGARGDPFWGALARGAVGIGRSLFGGAKTKLLGSGTIATAAGAGQAIMKRGGSMIMKHPVLSAAGAAGALGTVGLAERMLPGQHRGAEMLGFGACPKGFHISKSKHSKSFGACVRNRRMNVANGRALGRAVRRLHHFAKKYRKVVGFVSPKRPKGRMYFKKRKSK